MRGSSALPAVKPMPPGLRRAGTRNTKPPPSRQDREQRQTDSMGGRHSYGLHCCFPLPLALAPQALAGPLYLPPISQPLIQLRSLTAKKQQNKMKRTKQPPRHTLRILLHPLLWPRGEILTPKKVLQLLPPGGAETEQELGPLFPCDLYNIVVFVLVIRAASHLWDLLGFKLRHLGPKEAPGRVARVRGHVARVGRCHAPGKAARQDGGWERSKHPGLGQE